MNYWKCRKLFKSIQIYIWAWGLIACLTALCFKRVIAQYWLVLWDSSHLKKNKKKKKQHLVVQNYTVLTPLISFSPSLALSFFLRLFIFFHPPSIRLTKQCCLKLLFRIFSHVHLNGHHKCVCMCACVWYKA